MSEVLGDEGDSGDEGARGGHEAAATEAFLAHRNLLFTVAYEMLGSAADAEDVVQETWLRWSRVDLDAVRDRRAYLVRIATRQALTQLRTLGRRRESYVGPWLPEPLLTSPDVAEDVELADSVSMAMLLVLETLTPTERAVFVLREVFDVEYEEIAAAVDKNQAAVRQIAHRARAHVAARRPRGSVSGPRPGRRSTRSTGRWRPGSCRTCSTCSPRTWCCSATAAGSGRRSGSRWRGAGQVGRVLAAGLPRLAELGAVGTAAVSVNGWPALVIRVDGEIESLVALRIDDGLISGLYVVRNPDKLSRVERETAMSRAA